MAGLGHDLGGSLVTIKDGDDIEVHDLCKLFCRVIQKGRALGDAGVVDDRVQAAHIGGSLGKASVTASSEVRSQERPQTLASG